MGQAIYAVILSLFFFMADGYSMASRFLLAAATVVASMLSLAMG